MLSRKASFTYILKAFVAEQHPRQAKSFCLLIFHTPYSRASSIRFLLLFQRRAYLEVLDELEVTEDQGRKEHSSDHHSLRLPALPRQHSYKGITAPFESRLAKTWLGGAGSTLRIETQLWCDLGDCLAFIHDLLKSHFQVERGGIADLRSGWNYA